MNVVDIPQPAGHALYAEAAARYAALVRSRAVAVYTLGRAAYPGLTESRLLVVTDHVGMDNRFFFSALHRLPERLHRLFLREPFVLPGWSLRVMRYTRHYERQLLAGRDVLHAYKPSDDRDERWCRLLESYCAYAAFAEQTRRSQLLRGRETLATASALRSLLAEAAHIVPEAADDNYVNAFEAIRRAFFDEQGDPVERVRDAWELFAGSFDRFDRAMRERLNADGTGQAVAAARARLSGDEACEDFGREYAFTRSRDIAGYHHELASLGFTFGDLFPAAAHPRAVRTPAAAPILDRLLRNAYLVHRRIMEYAAG
ncbi:MAG TPA: hypothetical protein VFN37_06140 [Candidatus Baltobacteraceae bacterium]|nr:hypothetical protein [Candidatus Baltobacteraceae bacterium]